MSGLKATGSHDIVVKDAFVPDYRRLRWIDNFNCVGPGQAVNTSVALSLDLRPDLLSRRFDAAPWARCRACSTRSCTTAACESRAAPARSTIRACSSWSPRYGRDRRDEDDPVPQPATPCGTLPSAASCRRCASGWRTSFTRRWSAERCSVLAARLFKAAGGAGLYTDLPFGRILADITAGRQHVSNQYESIGRNYGGALFGDRGAQGSDAVAAAGIVGWAIRAFTPVFDGLLALARLGQTKPTSRTPCPPAASMRRTMPTAAWECSVCADGPSKTGVNALMAHPTKSVASTRQERHRQPVEQVGRVPRHQVLAAVGEMQIELRDSAPSAAWRAPRRGRGRCGRRSAAAACFSSTRRCHSGTDCLAAAVFAGRRVTAHELLEARADAVLVTQRKLLVGDQLVVEEIGFEQRAGVVERRLLACTMRSSSRACAAPSRPPTLVPPASSGGSRLPVPSTITCDTRSGCLERDADRRPAGRRMADQRRLLEPERIHEVQDELRCVPRR